MKIWFVTYIYQIRNFEYRGNAAVAGSNAEEIAIKLRKLFCVNKEVVVTILSIREFQENDIIFCVE